MRRGAGKAGNRGGDDSPGDVVDAARCLPKASRHSEDSAGAVHSNKTVKSKGGGGPSGGAVTDELHDAVVAGHRAAGLKPPPPNTLPNKRPFRKYDPRRLRPGLKLGMPPAGYCYIWAGNFRRWQRRYFVMHAPGVLVYYKRANRKGTGITVDLQGARVLQRNGHKRQFVISAGTKQYYMRTLHVDYRPAWVASINDSIATFNAAMAKAKAGSSHPAHAPQSERQMRVQQRLEEALAALAPAQQRFMGELGRLQAGVAALACALDLGGADRPTEAAARPQHVNGSGYESDGSIKSAEHALPSRDKVERKSIIDRAGGLVDGAGSYVKSHVKSIARRAFHSNKDTTASCAAAATHVRRRSIEQLSGSDISTSPPPSDVPPHLSPLPIVSPNVAAAGGSSSAVARWTAAETTQAYHAAPMSPGLRGALRGYWDELQTAVRAALEAEITRAQALEIENRELMQGIGVVATQSSKRRNRKRTSNKAGPPKPSDPMAAGAAAGGGGGNATLSPQQQQKCEAESDTEESDDSDGQPSTPSEGGDREEFFEALEVLNQHDYFVATSIKHSDGVDLHDSPEQAGNPARQKSKGDSSDDEETEEEEEEDEEEGEEEYEPRTRLPALSPANPSFNVWYILRSNLGKDLGNITLPVTVNEPLSGMQRVAEEMEYYGLLERAVKAPTSLERLCYLAAYALSPYSSAQRRSHKPFNPILGETFEWEQEGHYRMMVEQVCHHPPISAWMVESTHKEAVGQYTMYGELEFRTKFWGKTADLIPVGSVHLDVPQFNEHYSWNKVRLSIHDLITGSMWANMHGEITVHNHRTRECARVKILRGSTRETVGAVEGAVFDADDNPVYHLRGSHLTGITGEVDAAAAARGVPALAEPLLFRPTPLPPEANRMYNFTYLALQLNELTDSLLETLPPTDSRFRPDQRALEDGNANMATSEKLRIEERQRAARKQRKKLGSPYRARWFDNAEGPTIVHEFEARAGQDTAWRFNGRYWQDREAGDWDGVHDIF